MTEITESEERRRLIVLGASNVARSISTVVQFGHQLSRSGTDFLFAMGHGRSYGEESRVLGRRLPGILQGGLWRKLDELPALTTFTLVTDVGNDLVYGRSSTQLLDWVDTCCRRLRPFSHKVVITGLPLSEIRTLSPFIFRIVKLALFPRSQLTQEQVLEGALEVDAGLREMARTYDAVFVEPESEWYGLDPIHIKFSEMRAAWGRIFFCFSEQMSQDRVTTSPLLSLRLKSLIPEKRHLFGVEQSRVQPVWTTAAGDSISYF